MYLDVYITNKSLDKDIITETSGHDTVEKEEASDGKKVSDDATKSSFNEAMDVIIVFKNYSLFSMFGADLTKALKDIKLCR